MELKLPNVDGNYFKLDPIFFEEIWKEIEEFLNSYNGMNNLEFVKRILFNLEIKSNNIVEGITDDISEIETAIKNAQGITLDEKRKRILNLYNGYRFILKNQDINPKNLKGLYEILSQGLLTNQDSENMGEFYRKSPVYILKKGRLDVNLDEGVEFNDIEKYMNYYFDFINDDFEGTMTEQFIKSQIIHFYLVYIHPYFDVNGRTSRTVAMWYLLNNEAYPFIIFNRAINFVDGKYDQIIANCKFNCNISLFIKYMMENVKIELEKEMIMREIKSNVSQKMTAMDFQALYYFLSMNGEMNTLTFSNFYRQHNGSKKLKEIYEEIILPLRDKGIIKIDRLTKKVMFDGFFNEVYKLNEGLFNPKDERIKRLKFN